MTGKTLSVLIDFNFIINTDIGLIRFIRNNFEDERAFELNVLNKSDRELLSLLCFRNNWNPLSIISTKSNMENIDSLYYSIMNKYEREIINLSTTPVKIFTFVNTTLNAKGAGVTVSLCVHNDLQKSILKNKFRSTYINYNRRDINNMDLYYVKDYRFFTDIDMSVEHRNIYCIYSKYNSDYFANVNSPLTRTNEIMNISTIHKVTEEGENKKWQMEKF